MIKFWKFRTKNKPTVVTKKDSGRYVTCYCGGGGTITTPDGKLTYKCSGCGGTGHYWSNK